MGVATTRVLSAQGGRGEGVKREHLATAVTMYREMDMNFWLAQAEAEAEMRGLA
jgi:hypothetical protein